MTWNREKAAAGLYGVLEAGVSGRRYSLEGSRSYPGGDDDAIPTAVAVFRIPPPTFNPPAIVIGWPSLVLYNRPAFVIDAVTWPIVCAVAISDGERLDALMTAAREAIDADPSLGATVQACKPAEARNFRGLNVAGVEMMAGDLILDTRM